MPVRDKEIRLARLAAGGRWLVSAAGESQPELTSTLNTSPGSHSTETSNGRQQTSQSVVNRCAATLVSMAQSKLWPQNGQVIEVGTSISRENRAHQTPGRGLYSKNFTE